MFQSLIKWSNPLDAKIVPSELKEREVILEVCPLYSMMLRPDDISHNVMVPSAAVDGISTLIIINP